MQKKLVKVMRRKIVFVKVQSSVIKLSESVHWSRCCYAISLISVWNEFLLGTNEQSTKGHLVNIHFPKKLVQHTGEVRSC